MKQHIVCDFQRAPFHFPAYHNNLLTPLSRRESKPSTQDGKPIPAVPGANQLHARALSALLLGGHVLGIRLRRSTGLFYARKPCWVTNKTGKNRHPSAADTELSQQSIQTC